MDARPKTVRELDVGQVVSMPDTGLAPAVIERISSPVHGVRRIELIDLESGLRLERQMILALDRGVLVHPIAVAHHYYTNTAQHIIEVRLGLRVERVEPGETVHYTGEAKPTTFSEREWDHRTEAISITRSP